MSNYNKNQNGLITVFSEYFSDDNFKCQLWAALSINNYKITPYVFMTSSPLDSVSSADALPIRLTLLQASSLPAALEGAVRDPEAFGKGYQAAQSLDQSKSLTIKVGRSNDTGEQKTALFFKNANLSHVITLSSFESLGVASFLNAAVQAAINHQFNIAGLNVAKNGFNGPTGHSGTPPVHKKPGKAKDPLDLLTFDD